jgi:hypothetical protein
MNAVPNPVLVDTGMTATTSVMYNNDAPLFDVFLWERRNFQAWKRIAVESVRAPTGNPKKQGIIHRSLRPGELLQVVLYQQRDADPNVVFGDPEPVSTTAVVALRRAPESTLIVSEEFGPTGTSFVWAPRTSIPTLAVLQVSTEPPVTMAGGIQKFTRPIGPGYLNGYAKDHRLEIASPQLLPGNPFHALLRVTDSQGNWQYHHQAFTTWRRTVTVRLKELHIINDGASGDNTARFSVWVLQGDNPLESHLPRPKLKSATTIPERDISDSPSPGHESQEFIQLGQFSPSVVVLGPEVVTSDFRAVGVLTRGVASDSPGIDDIAGNYLPGPSAPPGEFSGSFLGDPFFDFPVGSQAEEVENRQLVVVAVPLDDREFEYTVEARISVEYGP